MGSVGVFTYCAVFSHGKVCFSVHSGVQEELTVLLSLTTLEAVQTTSWVTFQKRENAVTSWMLLTIFNRCFLQVCSWKSREKETAVGGCYSFSESEYRMKCQLVSWKLSSPITFFLLFKEILKTIFCVRIHPRSHVDSLIHFFQTSTLLLWWVKSGGCDMVSTNYVSLYLIP